jgi:hypothetical protein
VGWIAVVLMGSVACAGFEIGYFQGRVNETTEYIVVKRYGPPHIEQRQGHQTIWTYFDRGSAASGYVGTARSSFCLADVLTCDRQEILRGWNNRSAETSRSPITLLLQSRILRPSHLTMRDFPTNHHAS